MALKNNFVIKVKYICIQISITFFKNILLINYFIFIIRILIKVKVNLNDKFISATER